MALLAHPLSKQNFRAPHGKLTINTTTPNHQTPTREVAGGSSRPLLFHRFIPRSVDNYTRVGYPSPQVIHSRVSAEPPPPICLVSVVVMCVYLVCLAGLSGCGFCFLLPPSLRSVAAGGVCGFVWGVLCFAWLFVVGLLWEVVCSVSSALCGV